MSDQFQFNKKFDNFSGDHRSHNDDDYDEYNYSPRSSVVYTPEDGGVVKLSPKGESQKTNNKNDSYAEGKQGEDSKVSDNYKGFHSNRLPRNQTNVPSHSQPIKPRFRKKGSSLLGKLIYSNRKDSESSNASSSEGGNPDPDANDSRNSSVSSSAGNYADSNNNNNNINNNINNNNTNNTTNSNHNDSNQNRHSVGSSNSSGSNKFRFRLSSLNFDNHHNNNQSSLSHGNKSTSQTTKPRNNSGDNDNDYPPIQRPPTNIDLNIKLEDIDEILKTPPEKASNDYLKTQTPNTSSKTSPLKKSTSALGVPSMATMTDQANNNGNSWKAPDSWDVKMNSFTSPKDGSDITGSDSDDEVSDNLNKSGTNLSVSKASLDDKIDDKPNRKHDSGDLENNKNKLESNLPVLYGSRQSSHVVPTKSVVGKSQNHIIRVFREDNTFSTILSSLETTTAEFLQSVQKKFFLESTQNYQISVHIGNYVKVLDSFEKPLQIQMGILLLSGYTEADNLKIIGREDLSFLCKFVVESVYLRSLTHEEEVMLSKDYVDVNISGSNLKNIPIIFHQHTFEIESLNVADNPSIYIPLDFIQSCNYLTSIIFSRNGCSKFPINFLEAKALKYLDMEKNFLDEIPTKISHLINLKHLKLNSNQLCSLPKTFGKLINLETLNLSSNYFNSYPDAISDLINLKDLDISYDDLSVIPKSISRLTKLTKLSMCTNKLRKSLPSFFSELKYLKRLDIRYNYITNVDVLGSLSNLEAVLASKNNISGFSDKMESFKLLHFDRNPITNLEFKTKLINLSVLDLSKAKLTLIPPEFLEKLPSIEKLVLDKNHLVNLPENLGNLQKLNYLSLYGNNLQSLPSTIGQLNTLQYLDLHSNNLQTLPEEIWNLKSLTSLNVSSNLLNSFPKPPFAIAKRISSTVDFKAMQNSKLANDSIDSKGSLDNVRDNSSLSSLASNTTFSLSDGLRVLSLSDNRLTDECFEPISLLEGLRRLNLSYNDILEIPEGALTRLSKLQDLFLSGNELSSLPADDLDNLKGLKLFFLNNNKLVSLPAELSKLSNLEHLDVGSNQLKYNISNWPYDWNWHWNQKLKFLNFSGNKRFEIKQSHIKNPDTGEYLDSLSVLKDLKVLGLIDVTLTTTSVPEQNRDMRIRTTASELDSIGYGVSDSMGIRQTISTRDIFIQKFRGNENEVLFASFDGKGGSSTQGHKVSSMCKSLFASNFTEELNKISKDDEIKDAMRKAFLTMNKEINGILAAKKSNSFSPNTKFKEEYSNLDLHEDGNSGCSVTVIYIKDKKLYTANVGDTEALLSRNNGDYKLLTMKHDPTSRKEFERIRAAGGYVSGDGTLDGDLLISRGAGFFNYLPHTHSGPDITEMEITNADDKIVMATKVLWDHIPYEMAVDIIRLEKDDPMLAAQKLRDFAIAYGSSDKLAVIVISLGDQKSNRMKFGSNALYNNLTRESEGYTNKKKRDRAQGAGDTALRMLDDEIDPPVGELALVFTDIKNSTLLWDTYPVAMRSAIKIHNAIMRRQLRIVGGYEVKTEGDAFMVSFPSPTSALLWCFNVQQQLLTADWPIEILETDHCFEVTDNSGKIIFRGLSVRMGVHWGSPVCELDFVTRRMDYFGPMVNRTSRISALADGGQICISSDFLDEVRQLFDNHKNIMSGTTTITEAYHGNVTAGQIIEREIAQLEETELVYYEIGEKKLKGLEAPEHITLVYPKSLEIRFDIFRKQNTKSDSGERIFGTLSVEGIYGLREISLRLERICALLNGKSSGMNEGFQENSSKQLLEKSSSLFHESELLGLLNHIVIRIENCTAVLHMRQQVGSMNGRYDFHKNTPTMTLMNELSDIMVQFSKVTRGGQ